MEALYRSEVDSHEETPLYLQLETLNNNTMNKNSYNLEELWSNERKYYARLFVIVIIFLIACYYKVNVVPILSAAGLAATFKITSTNGP